jgi:alpha-mannosidase
MIREILLLHHTHTDIGYTHEQPIVWELNRQFIDDALDEIDRTADWDAASRPIWTCEVTETLRHWQRTTTPENVARFRRAAAAGRMSGCAMPFNFTPMLGVPQFVRSLAHLPELRRDLGLKFNVALNHDINGLPWTMVPLLLDAGVEMVMMGINVHFGGFPLHRPLFFRWIGPDGRSIIALNGEHYGMFQRYARLDENSVEAMAAGIASYEHKLAVQDYPHDFAYLSLTHYSFWDNNPPYPAAYDLIRRWNAAGRAPRIRFATPDELLAKAQSLNLPAYHGDWTDYWNFGAGSSAHETRLAHEARTNLHAADILSLQRANTRDTGINLATREAYDALTLWDEHTWGSYGAIADPDHDAVVAGWHHKAYPAYRTHALARFALTEQLEALAGNPRHAHNAAGVLIVNPSPCERTDYVSLPRSLVDGHYDHLSSSAHRFSQHSASENTDPAARAATAMALYGPVTIPAYGYLKIALADLRLEQAAGLKVEPDLLESPTHRLQFDAATGSVHSLTDKRSGREYVDDASEWPMLSLVHETTDAPSNTLGRGREPLLHLDYNAFQDTSFKGDWHALRTPEKTSEVRTLREAHRIGLEVRSTLPGARDVVKRIWLHAHRAEIAVDVALRKEDDWKPESLYLALPLNLPGWDMTFDTMGTPTRVDSEQLTGSCKDWVTVSGYADVHNAHAGVTLACPDMPLVMTGSFAFGKRQLVIDRSGKPLLLAWLYNNYWTTNFRASQPGYLRYHYELATHTGFDPVNAARVAAVARGPLLTHPLIEAPRTSSGALASVSGNGVVIAAALREDAGACIWLQNVTGVEQTAELCLPGRALRAATVVDTLGDPLTEVPVLNGGAAVTVPGRGIVALKVLS